MPRRAPADTPDGIDAIERLFDDGPMLDVAIRKADGSTAVDWTTVGVRTAPPLPVAPALQTILPDGLRRGSTVSVTGSLSLLLAVLGAASADGAWCALVGFGQRMRISAEAAREYGVDLGRLALVPAPGPGWTTAVGALLDALDIVVARPPARLVPGDVRRLAARARTKDAVLMPYLAGPGDQWQGADVRLTARTDAWAGLGDPTGDSYGSGRLRARRVEVSSGGRGTAARPRTTQLWLPADGGGVGSAAEAPGIAPVIAIPVENMAAG